jgi:hypothetical protein
MSESEPVNPYEAPRAEVFESSEPVAIPATLAGKFGLAFQLLFGDFPLFSAIVLTVWLPVNVLIDMAVAQSAANNPLFSVRLNGVVEAIVGPLVAGALIWVLSERLAGRKATYMAAMGVGFRSWGRLFCARFVAGLLTGLGFIALVVPGIVLLIRYCLIDPVVVLEGARAGVSQSRARSAALVKGKGWEILFAGTMYLVMTVVLGFSLGYLVEAVPALDHVWGAVAGDCVMDIFSVLITCLVMLYYLEARRKKPAVADMFGAKRFALDPEL